VCQRLRKRRICGNNCCCIVVLLFFFFFSLTPFCLNFSNFTLFISRYYEFVKSMLFEVANKRKECSIIAEKSPKTLVPLFPGAKYIYLVRDGRDVLVSLFYHHLRLGGFKVWCGGESLIKEEDKEKYEKNKHYFEENPEKLLAKLHCVRRVAKMWAERVLVYIFFSTLKK